MNKYTYNAKNSSGKYQGGEIEALDEKAAVKALREHDLFVLSISPKSDFLANIKLIGGGVSSSDVTHFTRYLATMLSTGLPLSDSLTNLQGLSNPGMSEVIGSVSQSVSAGSTLSAAMANYPKVFNNLYINLVKAGEASGSIDKALLRLADTLERQQEFQGKVRGAMVYPAIVVTAMGGIGALMITMVIPQIANVYTQFGADLPLPTKVLIVIANILQNYFLIVAVVVVILAVLLNRYKKTPSEEYMLSNLSYKIPVFGELNKEVTLAVFVRTLGALIGSGVAIADGLKITADVVGNNVYRRGIQQAIKDVEKGFPISLSLRNDKNFPLIISQMVGIGEETGTLDKGLERLAEFFESSSELKVKTLTTALEPILIMIMGVGVGGLAIAVLLPMFNLVNVIK